METARAKPARPIGPRDFEPFDGLPGLWGIARDEQLLHLWCNNEFAREVGKTPQELLGSKLSDVLPPDLVEQRLPLLRDTIDNGATHEYQSLLLGRRWITRLIPLDPAALGRRGIFVTICRGVEDPTAPPLQLISIPDLGPLKSLSRRELEVMYYVAQGHDAPEIAEKLFRSTHTVRDHIKSIHEKLGVSSRGELVRLAVSRGILGFGEKEWEAITAATVPHMPGALMGALGRSEDADSADWVHGRSITRPEPNLSTRALAPRDFEPFDGLPGLASVARDEEMRMLWCSDGFARIFESTVEELKGTDLNRTLPPSAAKEREQMLRRVMQTGHVAEFAVVGRGMSAITRAFPLDPKAFGTPGVMLFLWRMTSDQPGAMPAAAATEAEFGDLAVLSRRELEVLYWLAKGLEAPEISRRLDRSNHTVRDHIKSIHEKLHVTSRGEVVALAVARGVLAFTPERWSQIAATVRRPGAREEAASDTAH